jgi:hypothetical protein
MTARTARAQLTDLDRRHIDQARALAAVNSQDEICEHLAAAGLIEPGEFDGRSPYPFAFGSARSLLGTLADLAERLGGE